MHKKTLFGLLILVLIALPLLVACSAETTPTPTAGTPTPTAGPPTATPEAHWWDELGEPQYGGEIRYRVSALAAVFDIYTHDPTAVSMCFTNIFKPDRTVDPEIWPFNIGYMPSEYVEGNLIDSWEQPDPYTLLLHVKEGVRWQNKEPVNGRAFTAYDMEYYYDRLLGLGHGYTEPLRGNMAGYIEDVEVVDDYTVKADLIISGYATLLNFITIGPMERIDCEEVVEAAGGIVTDWHDVVSLGPWILTDFVTGSKAVYDRNPDFWDYDERYPENQLPYADKLILVCIPDVSTAMAALRTGQVDFLENTLLTQAQTLAESNPELLQAPMPAGSKGLSMRTDMEPFSDLRVRKAISLSINREELANVYYDGQADATPAGAALPGMDCCYAYDEWPQSLKDEYAYDVAGAKALLADAGYPDGFECSMWMQNTDDLQLAEIVKAYLLDIGIDATIEVTDGISLHGMIAAREYDGLLFGNGSGAGTLPQISARYYSKDFFLNSSVVNSPEYDAIHDKFAASATKEEAIAFLKEMDKMGIEQHWTTTTPCIYNFNIYQPYLKGYNGEAVNGNGMGGYYHARWWIDQGAK